MSALGMPKSKTDICPAVLVVRKLKDSHGCTRPLSQHLSGKWHEEKGVDAEGKRYILRWRFE